ncbi:CDP-alcohol phosphatidyltransferase family protein [Alsobacter sp. R-9]
MTADDTDKAASRRPLASRGSPLARRAVDALLRTSVTPNQISVISVLVAAVGAAALAAAPRHPWLFLVTAACVQLRLVCNLLDGMVAVEGGRGTPVGALYNEIPDRVADTLFLVAWGVACGSPSLGWAAALAAAVTAYIRVLGGALGQPQDFRGPMAKQHRMALLTAACVVVFVEMVVMKDTQLLGPALWLVLAGSLWTCVTRTRAIAARLR